MTQRRADCFGYGRVMTSSPVLYDVDNGVATITLNRPETLNAMNNELMGAILGCLQKVEEDETVRVVVLTGNGRGFCSGADLSGNSTDTGQGAASPGAVVAESMEEFFNPVVVRLSECPVPTICRINGVAAGGGLGLSLSTDISIASRSAFFVATFGPRLGIVPDVGSTWHLPNRVGRARALGISLLGDRITADEAVAMGMIWAAVDDDQLDAAVADLTDRLKRSSPDAVRRLRHAIDASLTNDVAAQLDVEREHQRVLVPANMEEGAAAFREKREPSFKPNRTAPTTP
ncbi:MAG: 2-(1,2-epoxy-1,2-dihydrophenyl)acetyl-CoA isomerase [Candidatus Poriferisodalaceae bacterium]|jgi:2-(1,2-epoxy-1,2-dihydrophenyl)acetyl-CoA isomerase